MTIVFNMANWGWPQYVYLGLSLLSVIGGISLHGKMRKPYDGYVSTSNFCIAVFLLAAGGFFA